MICRLATCDDAPKSIKDVIKALKQENKEYIYWGNNIAYNCDYLFIHSQGDSTIRGIIKVRSIKERSQIEKEDFLNHRPKGWDNEMGFQFTKYFLINDAKEVFIKLEELKDSNGNPKKFNAMREMSFVVWDKFEGF